MIGFSEHDNERIVFTEGGEPSYQAEEAVGLRPLFGSTRFECCSDTVSPTETFMESFHENVKASVTSLERKASFPHTSSSVFTKWVNVRAMEIVIVKTAEERIK